MIVNGYKVIIEPISELDDSGCAAVACGLPDCVSNGETPEEALNRLGALIDRWIETANWLRNLDASS